MSALNTVISVQGKQDPKEIFDVGLRQILFFEGEKRRPTEVETVWGSSDTEGREFIHVDPHDDIATTFAVYFRPGGEMVTPEEAERKSHGGCGEPNCPVHRAVPCHVFVGMATSIFYSDERGWNAGNLHAALVWAIGGFLDAKKIPWLWQDNARGALYSGYEELDGLATAVQNVRTNAIDPFGSSITREIRRRLGLSPEEE